MAKENRPGGPEAAFVMTIGQRSGVAWGEGTQPVEREKLTRLIPRAIGQVLIRVLDKANILDRRTYGHP